MSALPIRESITRREVDAAMRTVLPLLPRKMWVAAAQRQHSYAIENPFMRDFIVARHGIALGMASLLHAWQRSQHVPKMPRTNEEAVGAEFVVAAARAFQKLSLSGQYRLRRMIEGAIGSDAGLGSIAHEITTAAEFSRRGWEVSFEDMEQRGRYDLLAATTDTRVEIECKTVSGDIGRRVHERDFLRLVHRLNPILKILGRQSGYHLVEVDLLQRLPKDNPSHCAIERAVTTALEAGKCHAGSLGHVTYTRPFVPLPKLAAAISSRAGLREFVDDVYLRPMDQLNRMTVASAFENGCVVFTMKSQKSDKVVDGIYLQLKDKAANQFTKSHPAVLCVRLEAVSHKGLLELARRASTDVATSPIFQRMVNTLMAKRPWLHTIIFVPQSMASITRLGQTTESPAYVFRNSSHPLANDTKLRAILG